MFSIGFILFFLQSFYFIEQIHGHGYLADPPSRSSAWLFDKDFDTCCRYYNHAQMSCGGTYRQWFVHDGNCSICGEEYGTKPEVGMGGPKYLGKIVRTYTQGSIIPVTVVLTANHMGTFEFRVCSIDADPTKEATQSCLDLNVLKLEGDLTQYKVHRSFTAVHLNVTLPADLVCKHCVFQWKYKTGNSWGTANGKSCLGCGRVNEEFYGCSDIAINSEVETIVDTAVPETAVTNTTVIPENQPPEVAVTNTSDIFVNESTTTSTSAIPVTKSTRPPRKCTSAVIFSQSFDISSIMEQYCQKVCPDECAEDKEIGNEMLYLGCVNSCNKLCACG